MLQEEEEGIGASCDIRVAEHRLELANLYGELLAAEDMGRADLPAALRRFARMALERTNVVVVLDGVTHTRNSFLEFVREYDETAARAARIKPH
ncbi:MAG TPA: hypothetical protein VHL79_00920 [Ramlibacter sp.]|jgi:hypothetical protein|nr:hypothetical protein [Ramlibacter sp.]